MARISRRKSETGFYHIMLRGNERKVIFHDDSDKAKFMNVLETVRIPLIKKSELKGPAHASAHLNADVNAYANSSATSNISTNPRSSSLALALAPAHAARPDRRGHHGQHDPAVDDPQPRFHLHAYCLMDNHLHLLLNEGSEDISTSMKRITVSYVSYFNKKYKRVGHLFQDRYKSEVIDQESYLLGLSRYIHLNPVQAGMVDDASDYPWSSYHNYQRTDAPYASLVESSPIIDYYGQNFRTAAHQYKLFMAEKGDERVPDAFLDVSEIPSMTEEEAVQLGQKVFQELLLEYQVESDALTFNIPASLLQELHNRTHLSLRKLAEVTGLQKDRISRQLKK